MNSLDMLYIVIILGVCVFAIKKGDQIAREGGLSGNTKQIHKSKQTKGLMEMEDIKFYLEYDEKTTIVEKLKAHMAKHGAYKPEGIIIGYWNDAWEETPQSIIDYMVEHKALFPNLKRIHLGDIDSEECEISWINHTDTAPFLNEFELEELIIQGAAGLRLKNVKSDFLKKLTIISGGTASDVLQDIIAAQMPNLEHLELYLGVEDYGFNGDIATLEPFMQRNNFPKLKYLGLKNSEIADEICEKILTSDMLAGLEVLDLSLGTLSDQSAKLILANVHKLSHLKKLDLTYNYISNALIEEMQAAFCSLPVELIIDNEGVYIDEDDDYRYPYITE